MFFKSVAVALLSLSASVLAAPAALGITKASDGMPILNLPYASYKARYYDKSDDYYHFTNIRFAAPPVGALRWKRPQPPLQESGVRDGTVGNQCYQALPKTFSVGLPFLEALETSSEDCLFLDIRVPGSAIRGEVKNLPVLFWIFGGGYAMGSKSFFLYDGHPFLGISKNNLIWVAPNYRLGAFGWLNGPIPQAEGVANLGVHDQRAALQWVQNYIHLLNGDKTAVTAMGESAGAGSIMHHLVAEGGTLDPLFKRAILQSPAFEPLYSRSRLHTQYEAFASLAGCSGQGLDCLRTKSSEVLQAANIGVVEPSQYGTFGFGPGVDHGYIRDLPAAELAAGNYWKDVEIITGHTSNEGYLFTNPTFSTNKQVEDYIAYNFQNTTAAIRTSITSLYPAPGLFKPYSSQFDRVAQMVGEFVCTCNVRALVEAYAGKAYSYVFSAPPGIHGLDLVFTFWRTDLNIGQFQLDFNIPILSNGNLATLWQSYLASFARSGDPNKYRQWLSLPLGKNWAKATAGSYVDSLDLNFSGVGMTNDEDAPKDRCSFWNGKTWRSSQD